MKQKWFLLAIGLIALLGASAAFAQTTGSLVGIVTDADAGQPLPGVQVTVSSPALQGTRTAFTDGTGNFRFREIPPGSYKVVATLSGFGSIAQEGIKVGLDRTVEVRFKMTASVTEFVTVTGETPLVDTKSTTTGENISLETLQALPLGRNFTSAVRVAPGTHADETGYSVGGATGAENSYIIDGVESTEIERGDTVKQINTEFIQEVEVKTGGYEAEYGRAAGGVVNVITKSGGNEFHGDIFAYYEDDSLTDDFDGDGAETSLDPSMRSAFTRQDYGFGVGGFILKDSLWFFAAYDLVRNETTNLTNDNLREQFDVADEYTTTTDRDVRSLKLTWNINENHNVVFSLFGDPGEQEGAIGTISGEESTFLASREIGGDNYTLKYLGILHPTLFLNVQAAQHNQEDVIVPFSEEIQVRDRTQPGIVELRSGGFGGTTAEEFERNQYRADLTYFLDAAGAHELKFGFDMEKLEATKAVRYTGGQMIWIFPCGSRPCDPALGNTYYAHEFYVAKGTSTSDPAAGYQPNGLVDTPGTDNLSWFLQDGWDIGQNFTLNVGVRYENQTIAGGDGYEWIDLDNWAPRIGFNWDPTGAGNAKVTGFYGRFFQNIPMDINIRFMGTEADAFVYNQDLNSLDPSSVRAPRIRGAVSVLQDLKDHYGIEPVDPDLKGQSVDEFSLGYETQIGANWSFGVQGQFKKLNSVIEDGGATIPDVDGDGIDEFVYVVGNPGEGTMTTAPNLAYTGAFEIPKPKREYKAISLTAQRRLADNWGMYASYVWSELEGNYDGTYQRSTGQLDPMINSAFDYYDFSVVWTAECVLDGSCAELDGPLSNNREHQFKIDVYYSAKLGPGTLSVAASPYYMSGRPVTVQGWSDVYRNNELALTNRGAWGEMDDEYELDLAFGYTFPIGPVELSAKFDVFNALNRQGVTDVDMLWSQTEDGNSTWHDGASASEAPNPNFGQAIDWQDPRNYRISLKLSF